MFSTYFPPQYSGAAKQALSLAKELRIRGHQIEFVTVRWPGLSACDQVDGFPVWRLNQGYGRRHTEVLLWINLFRFAFSRRNQIDLLHSHGAYYRNSVVGPLGCLLRCRSVVKASLVQDDLAGVGHGLWGRLHRTFLQRMDACIAISRDLKAEFEEAGVVSNRIHSIPNGVDTKRFYPAPNFENKKALCRAIGLPEDRSLVLAVGVFDPRKKMLWLLEAWLRNAGFHSGAMLVAVGPRAREDKNGTWIRRAEALAAENPELLRCIGPVNDIERYYRAADVFVLPSESEGLPNVILEAMASGLPCVASSVSGTNEIVIDGVTGWTFAPGDEGHLGRALLAALGPAGASLCSAGRKRIEEDFSITVVAARYETLYGALLSGSTPCRVSTDSSYA